MHYQTFARSFNLLSRDRLHPVYNNHKILELIHEYSRNCDIFHAKLAN